MERKVTKYLLEWKSSPYRKPLILHIPERNRHVHGENEPSRRRRAPTASSGYRILPRRKVV